MFNAKDLSPTAHQSLKVLVIGESGTGKSRFASTFPEPILVLDCDKHPLSYRGKNASILQFSYDSKGWSKFTNSVSILTGQPTASTDEELKKFLNPTEPFKTVVVDSTTALQDIAMEKALFDNPAKVPEGKIHYLAMRFLLEKEFKKLYSLNCNLVIITHVNMAQDEFTGAAIAKPLLTGQLAAKLPAMFDEVLYSLRIVQNDKLVYRLQTQVKGYYNAKSILSGEEGLLDLYIPNDYGLIMEMIKSRLSKNQP